MSSIWRSLRRAAPEAYQLARLVDHRRWEETPAAGVRHVVCDIDKTYLETEFESLVRMIRIAFEAATDKITVAGASEVLLAARWGQGAAPRPLHFVSSSPPQLRAVLEEKLMLDGLDWSSDTFKNQAYNLRMRRMDLLRQHVAYKSLAILRLVAGAGADARFYMIGDNAETDAFIYTGVKLLLDGRLGAEGFRRYLAAAGVEEAVAADVAAALPAPRGQRVEAILIRNVPGYQLAPEAPLGAAVQAFDNFYQAALLLAAHGVIEPESLWELTRRFHNHHGMMQRQQHAMLAALRASGRGGDAIGRAAEAAMARLMPHAPADAADAFQASLAVDPRALLEASEDAIVAAATAWMERLRREKER